MEASRVLQAVPTAYEDESPRVLVWKGSSWIYQGRNYRSLRHLKIASNFKPQQRIEKAIAKELSRQIRIEIDNEILAAINFIANKG